MHCYNSIFTVYFTVHFHLANAFSEAIYPKRYYLQPFSTGLNTITVLNKWHLSLQFPAHTFSFVGQRLCGAGGVGAGGGHQTKNQCQHHNPGRIWIVFRITHSIVLKLNDNYMWIWIMEEYLFHVRQCDFILNNRIWTYYISPVRGNFHSLYIVVGMATTSDRIALF